MDQKASRFPPPPKQEETSCLDVVLWPDSDHFLLGYEELSAKDYIELGTREASMSVG